MSEGKKMMKKGDFVSVSYTGKIAESGEVFDLTDEKKAKDAGLFTEKVEYGPMVVMLGSGHMLSGLEEVVMQMKPGESRKVVLEAEKAFGPRDPKRVQTLPDKVFRGEQAPRPGMVINIQGLVGKVQSVTAGRVVVDFNHPLAGKAVEYDITLEKPVTDPAEQFGGVLRLHAHKGQASNFSVSGDTAEVVMAGDNQMPAEVMMEIAAEAKAGIPQIKKVKFCYLFE
jgi:FKBP-type peptidyl-prolyl cis-trans isomerase 2